MWGEVIKTPEVLPMGAKELFIGPEKIRVIAQTPDEEAMWMKADAVEMQRADAKNSKTFDLHDRDMTADVLTVEAVGDAAPVGDVIKKP